MNKGSIAMVNEYLMQQLDALTEEDVSAEEMESRIQVAEAVTKVSEQLIKNGNLALSAVKASWDYGGRDATPTLTTGLLGCGDE